MSYKIVIGSIALLLASVAQADNPALKGVFVNPSQSDAGIKSAIESIAREFNFVTRPIARSRLKKHNPAIRRVEIKQGAVIEITLENAKPSAHAPGQPPVKWVRPDGEVFNVSMEWHGATLVQTFTSEEGTRVNRYTLSADGAELTMDVALSGPQMPRTMKYMLTYKRDSDR